jgi:hypothetical protein
LSKALAKSMIMRSIWIFLSEFAASSWTKDSSWVSQENYRPISLTCISCKIMEHVITKHILNHLESASSWTKDSSWVSQDLECLKPCWRSYNKLLLSRWLSMCFVMTCSLHLYIPPDIQILFNNINPHTASGPDNISGRILKDLQNFNRIVNIIL